MTIIISIPSYRKVEQDAEKSHTVYCIGVNTATQSYTLEKRYSEFEALHKKIKKKRSDLPNFPAKTVLKWNPKVLETRRQLLEAYLQDVVKGSEIPRSLLTFLNLPNIDSTQPHTMSNLNNSSYNSAESLDVLEKQTEVLSHQPIIAFLRDCFLQDFSCGGDVITNGVLQAMYSSYDDIS